MAKVREKDGVKTVYVYGFGDCYYAETMQQMPTEGEHMRYYGSEDGYSVYGTDVPGINKYERQDSVELWAIKQ